MSRSSTAIDLVSSLIIRAVGLCFAGLVAATIAAPFLAEGPPLLA